MWKTWGSYRFAKAIISSSVTETDPRTYTEPGRMIFEIEILLGLLSTYFVYAFLPYDIERRSYPTFAFTQTQEALATTSIPPPSHDNTIVESLRRHSKGPFEGPFLFPLHADNIVTAEAPCRSHNAT